MTTDAERAHDDQPDCLGQLPPVGWWLGGCYRMTDPPAGPSRITYGAVTVLAHLHETDATCREVTRNVTLSESSVYRWLTELADAGILETEAVERSGRAVLRYHLPDDDLGAAAHVIVDRLGRTGPPE